MIPGSLDPGLFGRISFSAVKRHVRRYFWLWIAYQTIKGMVTTTVIWIPLLYLYFFG